MSLFNKCHFPTVVALMFVPLGDRGISIPAIRFHFNMYTGPVYFNILMDIINLLMLVGLFREYKINFKKSHKGKELTRKGVHVLQITILIIFAPPFRCGLGSCCRCFDRYLFRLYNY